ncbi:hypothetical protein GCM10011297_32250 [Bacterioplanes sanyensis]|uniref:hypothetical protein n=1 Tax=Bacterioplanes sanyensis TaxID=1249553 RepID=UPI0016768586|nr:hypothetical protein [Bacterioplanes sanyensis]GGY57065.1 hypothetical protein GCM10011297_32250 [Bacterioplanes sanyensis]
MRWLVCALTLVMACSSYAGKLYRFQVDGRTIVKDHVPSEYSHLGYEVLNSRGMVIEYVERAPTPEELQARKEAEARQEARKQAISERRAKDLELLRLYAKPEDVERARQRRVDELEAFVSLERRRITDLEEKLNAAQGRAANVERVGGEVPADMRLEVVSLQNRIDDIRKTIDSRRQEMIENTKQYAEQYERMRVLQVYKPGTLDDEVDYDRVDQALGDL